LFGRASEAVVAYSSCRGHPGMRTKFSQHKRIGADLRTLPATNSGPGNCGLLAIISQRV